MVITGLTGQSNLVSSKILNSWYEELSLPVAPACNMMCNFCSKDSDCVCNGNNPGYLSKTMTPRQAVNWACLAVNKNKRIKLIKISGPGEPLFNNQTFEVLRRLNVELPDSIYGVCTNGLNLAEKYRELLSLNVRMVEVSMNAVFENTISKLYSRLIKDQSIITGSQMLVDRLPENQFRGIKLCVENGMKVRVNAVYFPGINENDILCIASRCKEIGVKAMCIISSNPAGKLSHLRTPTITELVALKEKLLKTMMEIEIKSFVPSAN